MTGNLQAVIIVWQFFFYTLPMLFHYYPVTTVVRHFQAKLRTMNFEDPSITEISCKIPIADTRWPSSVSAGDDVTVQRPQYRSHVFVTLFCGKSPFV